MGLNLTWFDLAKISEVEENGGKFEEHKKSRKLNDNKSVDGDLEDF